MSKVISKLIESKTGHHDLVEILSEKLSGTELNSLMLEVYSRRSARITPSDLVKSYATNRFVQPAESDYIHLLEKSLAVLKVFSGHGFIPVNLSPLAPFGTCSVVGTVDQDKVVTALRSTEVLADATNALALYISHQKKNKMSNVNGDSHLKYSAVQRHVRAQQINFKGFTPHFTIGCLVSSGVDTGNYTFEKTALVEQIKTMNTVLTEVFKAAPLYVKLQRRSGYAEDFRGRIFKHLQENLDCKVVVDEGTSENNYYKGVQFKILISIKGKEIEIADGGIVDWTQKLLNNKKERYCIAGFGLEVLNKFEEDLI